MEGCISPWSEPITSPYLDRVQNGLPAYEVNGSWPWEEDFFPKHQRVRKRLDAGASFMIKNRRQSRWLESSYSPHTWKPAFCQAIIRQLSIDDIEAGQYWSAAGPVITP